MVSSALSVPVVESSARSTHWPSAPPSSRTAASRRERRSPPSSLGRRPRPPPMPDLPRSEPRRNRKTLQPHRVAQLSRLRSACPHMVPPRTSPVETGPRRRRRSSRSLLPRHHPEQEIVHCGLRAGDGPERAEQRVANRLGPPLLPHNNRCAGIRRQELSGESRSGSVSETPVIQRNLIAHQAAEQTTAPPARQAPEAR